MPLCLIVEDHGDTREGYAEFLSFSGFEVATAGNGDEMRHRLATGAPDVVVMDLQLPDKDGWTLIRELRSSAEWGALPIVVVSASVREEDRTAAFEAGASAFIPKPCSPEAIVEELHRLLGSAGRPAKGV